MPPEDQTPGEALIAGGAQLIKIEDDRMTSVALAHPRNESQVKAEAIAELEDDPGYAAEIYYSIPYKNHTRRDGCTGRADDQCPVESEVEGLSIEGARNLARRWRNNVSRVVIQHEDADGLRLTGIFVDLETNQKIELPFAVSKLGVRRDGSVYDLNPTRLAMTVQASASKVARNAILGGIPASIKRAYFQKAQELARTVPVDVGKLVEAFGLINVTRDQLETYFGGKLEDLDDATKRKVRAVYTAIREKLVEPATLFASWGEEQHGASSRPASPSDAPAWAAQALEGPSADQAPTAAQAPALALVPENGVPAPEKSVDSKGSLSDAEQDDLGI